MYQALIAESCESELKIVVSLLRTHIAKIAVDRYGSIFLQKAFHYMQPRKVYALICEIRKFELKLAVHCYASYFLQVSVDAYWLLYSVVFLVLLD